MDYKNLINYLLDELTEAKGCDYVQALLESWGLDDLQLLSWGFEARKGVE